MPERRLLRKQSRPDLWVQGGFLILTIHRTTPTDIIGGLGHILGLFGLWAYCLSQRKKNS
jgi:hypothetical protein